MKRGSKPSYRTVLEAARRRIVRLEIALADAENRARMAEEDAAAMRSGGETYAELYWRSRAEVAEGLLRLYEVAYIDDYGEMAVKKVEARGPAEAVQLAGAPVNSTLAIIALWVVLPEALYPAKGE